MGLEGWTCQDQGERESALERHEREHWCAQLKIPARAREREREHFQHFFSGEHETCWGQTVQKIDEL